MNENKVIGARLRPLVGSRAMLLGVLAGLALACESPGPEAEPEDSRAGDAETAAAEPAAAPAFSGVRAYADLEQLASMGPRRTATRGAARARSYLRRQLAATGARVEEMRLLVPEPGAETALESGSEPRYQEAVHVVGVLPGESDDRFLLAAAYDTREIAGVEFAGANASASGPALLLELARTLAERQRPYTIAFAFVDGDRLPPEGAEADFPGTRALAARLQQDPAQGFDRIRLAVFFQQVGDLDLSVARDLRSHHVYREFFWEAAGVLGLGAYFPPDASEESIAGSHLMLIEAGLPRTVLVADPRYGGSEIPGRHAASDRDTPERCSPHSLEVVGRVTLEALDRIAERLARIDRFRESPLQEPLGSDPREAVPGIE